MRNGKIVSAAAVRWLHVAWLWLAFFTSCRAPLPLNQPGRFEFTEPQMGLPFRVVLYAADKWTAEAAARVAFDRIQQLNIIMSDYEDDSELSRLSRTAGSGEAVKVSNELWFVLRRAQKLAERTDGAFDVTVGPVVSLWRKARREKKLPDAARLTQALQAVGYEKLRLDSSRHTVQLLVRGMRLDLGAMLANAGLATSGDLFQRVEIDGRRYSHIVDPRTGIGLTDHSLVTVIAADGITADSLATAVSVLGPEKGMRLIEETQGAAAHVVRMPSGRIETTESGRFKQLCERPQTD